MNRRLLSLIGFLAVVAVVVVVVVVASGDDSDTGKKKAKDDPQPNNQRFHTRALADHYGGPVPMTVKFNVKPFNENGDVAYRWHFDDGTASSAVAPAHTFSKPGTYQVLLDARDSTGDNDRWNLVVGAWPADVWGTTKPEDIPKEQAAQKARSAKRNAEVAATASERLGGF
jgi:hypothetical protein